MFLVVSAAFAVVLLFNIVSNCYYFVPVMIFLAFAVYSKASGVPRMVSSQGKSFE